MIADRAAIFGRPRAASSGWMLAYVSAVVVLLMTELDNYLGTFGVFGSVGFLLFPMIMMPLAFVVLVSPDFRTLVRTYPGNLAAQRTDAMFLCSMGAVASRLLFRPVVG